MNPQALLPFLGLLLAAVALAGIATHYRIPYSLALVLFGLLLGLAGPRLGLLGLNGALSELFAPGVFFGLFLPPIIFEAALHIDARRLRARAWTVLFLAFAGVVFTLIFTGYLLAAVVAVPLTAAFLLAAILSPTDPIAVIDLFRRLDVPAELSTIVESESILNDAVGVILFLVLLSVVTGGPDHVGGLLLRFAGLVAGGVAVGAGAAALVRLLVRPMKDPVVGIAVSVLLAYGSYVLANAVGGSGILATAVAGLAVGTWVLPHMTPVPSRGALVRFWGLGVYAANSVIFLAMGLLFGTSSLIDALPWIALVFLLILAGRALFVYAHRPLARAFVGPDAVLPARWYGLIAVAGVRGAIPVVLALSLEVTATDLSPSTVRTVVATVLGVVLVSLVVNNLVAQWFANAYFARGGVDPSRAAAGPD